MRYTILDCYTDEPAGLGVPPYIGTYPRYIYGKLSLQGHDPKYITIDDLRLARTAKKNGRKKSLKTDIRTYNSTGQDADRIIKNSDILIVIAGVHVPGKYLSAIPGTIFEVSKLLEGYPCKKILTGPGASELGSSLEGGRIADPGINERFDECIPEYVQDYEEIAGAAIEGAKLIKTLPYEVIAEIETGRGCSKAVPCSFCTEPLKHDLEFRNPEDIIAEVKALNMAEVKHFRLGKQSDLFSIDSQELEHILSSIKKDCDIKTLHIDNIDPAKVTEDRVKMIVKYCTSGNVAALGVESFDPKVIKANCLNSSREASIRAIRLINRFGRERGDEGMPRFLPGINLLFGLIGEDKETHEKNMEALAQILDEDLMLRRINIRQVAVFPGTQLHKAGGTRYIKKNKRHYWSWRNEIRQKIDNPMLKRVAPVGTVLKGCRAEVHDGNTTFCRQWGTYPLIIGVKERLELKKSYDIEVTGHMLRSLVGKVKSDQN